MLIKYHYSNTNSCRTSQPVGIADRKLAQHFYEEDNKAAVSLLLALGCRGQKLLLMHEPPELGAQAQARSLA